MNRASLCAHRRALSGLLKVARDGVQGELRDCTASPADIARHSLRDTQADVLHRTTWVQVRWALDAPATPGGESGREFLRSVE
jgi:hypothetical protein